VLQTTDLPTGWSGTPYKPDPTGPAQNAAFAACLGARNTSLAEVADVHSQNFAMGHANISSEAASYPSHDDLAADLALLTNAKFSSCFETGLRAALGKTLPAGATISSVDVKVTPGAGGGPSNVSGTLALTVTVANPGLTQTIYSTTVYMVGPLIEAQLVLTNSGQPFPAALQATLIKAVAARAATG
jgi:phage tail protein X